MKRFVSVMLCFTLVLSLVACGTDTSQINENTMQITQTDIQEAEKTETEAEELESEQQEAEDAEAAIDTYSQEYYLEQAKELGIADASY